MNLPTGIMNILGKNTTKNKTNNNNNNKTQQTHSSLNALLSCPGIEEYSCQKKEMKPGTLGHRQSSFHLSRLLSEHPEVSNSHTKNDMGCGGEW